MTLDVEQVRASLEQLCRVDPGALLPPRRRAAVPAELLATPWQLADLASVDPSGGTGPSASHVSLLVDPSGGRWLVPVVAHGDEVRRAIPGDGVSEALVAALRAGGTEDGRLRTQRLHAEPAEGERVLDVDQTNESVVVGERAVVKWYERASDQHPAPARVTALADGGFTAMPRPWGFVWWDLDGRAVLVAAVAELLDQATDGWTWCVEDCRAWDGTRSDDGAWQPMRRAGRIVADLHATLSAGSDVRATTDEVAAWHQRALRDLERALDLVDGPEGERLAARAAGVRTALDGVARVHAPRVVPVHGDLHVGQLLKHRTADGWDYALTDFDGNPVLSAEEREAWQPVARDVAGMLQSIDHVGRVVVRRTPGADPRAVATWVDHAQRAFLDTYRDRLTDHPGAADLLDERLLRPFAVEQECRELIYAATHLPHWRYVPDAALADLLRRPEEGPA